MTAERPQPDKSPDQAWIYFKQVQPWERQLPDFDREYHLAHKDDPAQVRIGGYVHYQLQYDIFGGSGAWHRIRLEDGQEFETKQLYRIFTPIPEDLQEELPDNAIFVTRTGIVVDYFGRIKGHENDIDPSINKWLGIQEEKEERLKATPWVPKWKWRKQRTG